MSFARPEAVLSRILTRIAGSMTDDHAEWVRAMLQETKHIDNGWERSTWVLGVVLVTLRLRIASILTDAGHRPCSVTASLLYLMIFSGYLFFHTVSQLISPGVHESWTIALFPVVASLLLTLLPAAIAVGLWYCDALARWMTIAFVVLDLYVVLTFAHAAGFNAVRSVKTVCDLLIVAAMFSQDVRDAFNWRSHPALGLME